MTNVLSFPPRAKSETFLDDLAYYSLKLHELAPQTENEDIYPLSATGPHGEPDPSGSGALTMQDKNMLAWGMGHLDGDNFACLIGLMMLHSICAVGDRGACMRVYYDKGTKKCRVAPPRGIQTLPAYRHWQRSDPSRIPWPKIPPIKIFTETFGDQAYTGLTPWQASVVAAQTIRMVCEEFWFVADEQPGDFEYEIARRMENRLLDFNETLPMEALFYPEEPPPATKTTTSIVVGSSLKSAPKPRHRRSRGMAPRPG
ncbi:hypothetical protein HLH33_00650 [Gluconacetobacter diazotrophicus]|uniref:Uncharacterized protein n=1 Tax=Gluconacetobacter diazotrophicus TaxID=33996 RepID=A0A7W4FC16_GLUDI|nr:hypothetical protein [Gluconacetobacter diazotrophicus]MBB2154829.1 hypothetical protein [Gluconacetobacter diazotrophicus]